LAGTLEGEIAIVTGAAGGMGAAHVRRFVKEGARVIATDIDERSGSNLAREFGENVHFVKHDVSDPGDWQAAIQQTEEKFGPATILVNNAGIVVSASIEDMLPEDYLRVIRVNQFSMFLGMKYVVSSMKRAGKGSIINISSTAGLVGTSNLVAYAASKFAVRGMTKAAANEFGAYNIRVNSVHPGPIETAMLGEVDEAVRRRLATQIVLRRVGQPSDVANLVLFLASSASDYCTGAEFVIDGGLTAH